MATYAYLFTEPLMRYTEVVVEAASMKEADKLAWDSFYAGNTALLDLNPADPITMDLTEVISDEDGGGEQSQ